MIEVTVIGKDGCNDSATAKTLVETINTETPDEIVCVYKTDNTIDSLQITVGGMVGSIDQLKLLAGQA